MTGDPGPGGGSGVPPEPDPIPATGPVPPDDVAGPVMPDGSATGATVFTGSQVIVLTIFSHCSTTVLQVVTGRSTSCFVYTGRQVVHFTGTW